MMIFNRSGFSNQINVILEPVSMGLGFTVLPSHAVGAFKENEKVKVHRLTHNVSETLYIGVHSKKFISDRVNAIIADTKNTFKSVWRSKTFLSFMGVSTLC